MNDTSLLNTCLTANKEIMGQESIKVNSSFLTKESEVMKLFFNMEILKIINLIACIILMLLYKI